MIAKIQKDTNLFSSGHHPAMPVVVPTAQQSRFEFKAFRPCLNEIFVHASGFYFLLFVSYDTYYRVITYIYTQSFFFVFIA